MEKATNSKNGLLILLGIVGLGLYLYYRKKGSATALLNYPTAPNPAAPSNDTGVPVVQVLDANNQLIADNSYRAHFSLSGHKKLGNVPNTI
jgi:hypothetical protein